ncbi:Uncharacterised protein [Nocardia otitidiscaviarum]|uniref:Rv3651-like N-terminal domain-containing protein n=1 Tax=Nocardia otitidiscaviarum TaxID=1823 RepID=A0A378Y8A8_9NOCA|nr:GAF domain-containing protein [Nocardia otitidiscaviarum]SUA72780.1 Uncharacterised protein [Nocardia otitidiscaviarum]
MTESGRAIPWVTVETLTPDTMSVATVGGEQRAFASVRRVLQRVLTRTPAVYDSITTRGIIDVVQAARRQAEQADLEVPTAAGQHLVRARPVLGPTGGVHAVQLWIGPAAAVTPPPPAVGAVWDLDSQTVHQPPAMTALRGVSADEHVPTMSVAELFHRAAAFDRHGEVLDLLYDPGPEDKLQFDVDIGPLAGRSAGPLGRWRVAARPRDRGAWLLIEDIREQSTQPAWPTLEQVGLREAHRRAGTHLAVVQLEHTSISHWLTDPAPWVRWEYLYRPVDVFHPDDRDRLAAVRDNILAGESAEVIVCTLGYSGNYLPTRLRLYPYPGYSRSQLVIGELRLADDHCESPSSRAGPCRIPEPLGYDEQLRRHLSRRDRFDRAS